MKDQKGNFKMGIRKPFTKKECQYKYNNRDPVWNHTCKRLCCISDIRHFLTMVCQNWQFKWPFCLNRWRFANLSNSSRARPFYICMTWDCCLLVGCLLLFISLGCFGKLLAWRGKVKFPARTSQSDCWSMAGNKLKRQWADPKVRRDRGRGLPPLPLPSHADLLAEPADNALYFLAGTRTNVSWCTSKRMSLS